MNGRPPIVIALGGNALLRRGEPPDIHHQLANVDAAAEAIARVARGSSVVVTHGNGPQVGLLALQAEALAEVEPYPFDVLGAESEGMIGYLIEQALGNHLGGDRVATLLTQVVVDGDDPAFAAPSKPVGQVYDRATAQRLASERGWSIAPDGASYRRVVPSPQPRDIVELEAIRTLLGAGMLVICSGGGGIPVVVGEAGRHGVEAVIDKDLSAALLAERLGAEMLILATDVDAVRANWGEDDEYPLGSTTPAELRSLGFAAGSMGPKVDAACRFVEATAHRAVIGALEDIEALAEGRAGTLVAG